MKLFSHSPTLPSPTAALPHHKSKTPLPKKHQEYQKGFRKLYSNRNN